MNFFSDTFVKLKLQANYKEIITEMNNKDIVEKISLTDFDKDLIESCLGRIRKNKALLDTVCNRGVAGYKEFITVLRESNRDLADRIENTKGMNIRVQSARLNSVPTL